MRIVNPIDQIFLRLERRNQPMHAGGLQLFQRPADAGPQYVHDLVVEARQHADIRPPFNRRIKYHFGQPFWVEDQALDLEYHVRHLALPAPGAIRDLLALISMLHSNLLDRARPLWEIYFIEGVTDNRFAIYSKFNHALMDGVSAMRVMRKSLTTQPTAGHLLVPWHRDANTPPAPAEHHGWSSNFSLKNLRTGLRQARALPGAGREVFRAFRDAYNEPEFTRIDQAPKCMLNRRISGSRRFAAQSYSLTRIKRLASTHGVTVNDIVLAMCGSALRRYLAEHDGLPNAPLIAMLPVSLHEEGDDNGNRIGLIFANLATNIADPVARLDTIRRSVNHWKRRYQSMSAEQIMAFVGAISTPAGLNLLTGLLPRKQSFNVVISNVPGPDKTLYCGDAEQTGMYPVSIVLDGQALNISLVSYRDSLEFGLLACRRSVPSMQHLLGYLADALDELEPKSTENRAIETE